MIGAAPGFHGFGVAARERNGLCVLARPIELEHLAVERIDVVGGLRASITRSADDAGQQHQRKRHPQTKRPSLHRGTVLL